jgi:hypothetical protein
MSNPYPEIPHHDSAGHVARLVLFSFVLTFVLARFVVFLIMSRCLPSLYLFCGDTHVHHLNYGILLLAGTGTYLLFEQPFGKRLHAAGLVFGVGLALTFDEFGMWLHLGGSYWQRASWDAVVLVTAFLGLISYAPPLSSFRSKHWWGLAVMVLMMFVMLFIYFKSRNYAAEAFGPRIHEIELGSPHYSP